MAKNKENLHAARNQWFDACKELCGRMQLVTVHLRKHQHGGPARIAYKVNNDLIGALAVLMCRPHGQLPIRCMEVNPVGGVLGPTGICNATQKSKEMLSRRTC